MTARALKWMALGISCLIMLGAIISASSSSVPAAVSSPSGAQRAGVEAGKTMRPTEAEAEAKAKAEAKAVEP